MRVAYLISLTALKLLKLFDFSYNNSSLSTDDIVADGDNDCAGEVVALLRRAGENRRAAETVARHMLARLDNASATGGMGPWDDYSHTTRYNICIVFTKINLFLLNISTSRVCNDIFRCKNPSARTVYRTFTDWKQRN